MTKRNPSELEHSILGVPGRLFAANPVKPSNPCPLLSQKWKSESRPVKGYYEKDAKLRVEIYFDDNCKNGHQTFSITGYVTAPGHRDWLAGGCLHDDIAATFPELAPLIKWHLVSTDGPMGYVGNTLYHAGDRDYNGLRAGEKRPLMARDGIPHWALEAVTGAPEGLGVSISDTETGRKYIGRETVPLFILTKDHKGEVPPVTPVLRWVQQYRIGEGKARDLNAARSCAVWPDATDAELSADPEVLKAALVARLPGLISDFRAAMDSCGFAWDSSELEGA